MVEAVSGHPPFGAPDASDAGSVLDDDTRDEGAGLPELQAWIDYRSSPRKVGEFDCVDHPAVMVAPRPARMLALASRHHVFRANRPSILERPTRGPRAPIGHRLPLLLKPFPASYLRAVYEGPPTVRVRVERPPYEPPHGIDQVSAACLMVLSALDAPQYREVERWRPLDGQRPEPILCCAICYRWLEDAQLVNAERFGPVVAWIHEACREIET